MDLHYDFREPDLFELALTHASRQAGRDNERLEFLGDAALDLIVAEELYHHHGLLPEGALTELKAGVVSRRTLAQAALLLDLGGRAHVGGGLRGRALPSSVLANLYEALLGAIYLDGGFEPAREFVRKTLSGPLERARELRSVENPKQRLQHLTQARWSSLPTYEVIEERGRAHARAFLVRAQFRGRAFPSAWGRTRKEAESWAAHEALLVLDEEGPAAPAAEPQGPGEAV
jgi:ribonuclease-3